MLQFTLNLLGNYIEVLFYCMRSFTERFRLPLIFILNVNKMVKLEFSFPHEMFIF